MYSQQNPDRHLKQNYNQFYWNYSAKIEIERILPNSFHEANITLIPKPDKDQRARKREWENYKAIYFSANYLQTKYSHIPKKIVHSDQVGFNFRNAMIV